MAKKGLILLLIIIILLSFTSCSLDYRSIFDNYNKMTIDPKSCEAMFELSPQEFCDTKGEGTPIENRYTFARVNKKGYLILVLSDKELNYWKTWRFDVPILQAVLGKDIGVDMSRYLEDKDHILYNLFENADKSGFEISDDYSSIIASPNDDISYFPFLMQGCIFMQMCEGIPTDEIRVEYIVLDENQNIIEKIVHPDSLPQN